MFNFISFLRFTCIVILLASVTSCDKQEQAAADTGCCQVATGSCASPVTKAQCDNMNGQSFHAGGTCRRPAGECGVLQK